MTPIPHPLLVIGGGNMGRAIVEGAVRAGTLRPDRTAVLDPDPAKHAPFASLGCSVHAEPSEAMGALAGLEDGGEPGMVLLAVKPQMLTSVADSLGGDLRSSPRLIMSILAGATTSRLSAVLGGRVVRLMPNTPAQIGQGITAVTRGPGASAADMGVTRSLFESVGRVVELPEDLLDAFTAVAGSGPAYVFYLAEAMAAGAEAVGFEREQALDLARATVVGAAGLLQHNPGSDPADLRSMVTSKGGTTAAATAMLDERGVVDAFCAAITAARDRGRELASG